MSGQPFKQLKINLLEETVSIRDETIAHLKADVSRLLELNQELVLITKLKAVYTQDLTLKSRTLKLK